MDGLKLISAILEAGSVDAVRRLKPDLFLDNERPVLEMVRRHYRQYGQLPAFDTVRSEAGVRLPQATENVDYYLTRVHNRKLYTDITPEFGRLRDSLKNNDMDAVREIVRQMRLLAQDNNQEEDNRSLLQALQAVRREYEVAKYSPGLTGVPSGWYSFDEATGGYQNGDLISWIARMGMGKTYLLLQQAITAWEAGFSVLVVTMEMTIPQITRRASGMLANINPEYIRRGTLSNYAERQLYDCMETLQHADRFSLYAGGFSKQIDDVEMLMQEFSPDIVFIDGVYLLRPAGSGRMNRLERVAEVLDDIKKITIKQNRPIVVTSQFSRGAGKKGKEGSLETVGFSDAFGFHSSIVVSIKEGKPPHQNTRRTIEFLKGREGEKGEFQTNYTFAPIDFTELPRQVDENGEVLPTTEESVNLDFMGSQS